MKNIFIDDEYLVDINDISHIFYTPEDTEFPYVVCYKSNNKPTEINQPLFKALVKFIKKSQEGEK